MERWTSGTEYEKWMGRWSRLVALEFLRWLAIPPGLKWLDVCCGSGIVTEIIAEQSHPASIVGVDLSSAQVDHARSHRSRSNIRFELADATALPFKEAEFDIAVCGLGLNFIPDPVRALKEIKRVLRPGGTVAVYVWDYAKGARFVREFWDAAIAVDPEAAALDQGRRFTICTKAGLEDVFTKAGFTGATSRALETVTRFSNFDDYWTPLLTGQGSAPGYIATRDEKTRSAIRERLRATLPAKSDGSIELPARAWAVRVQRDIV
jgi:SAM-dependent methyltransferase